ncbi:MAG: amino acid ABC transporter substrate-binding protein [Chloroflexi bacterium]|nr:amino acid ABC transporter substrate-binding protein [Chloroflexota bacterium]
MTLVVGMPVSLSGQFQAQGRQALAGLLAWERDANTETPESFRVLHYDDASDPSTVREVTRRLIVDDRVDILIGPYSSVLASAAAQVAETHGKLLWNQGGASDDVYRQGYRWTVGILTPASRYLTGLLPLVRQANPSANTVALVKASTGEFPQAVCSGVAETAEDLGFKIVLTSEFSAATVDFTDVLDELRAARPDVVVVVGRVQNDLRLARQLAESGINAGTFVAVAAGIQAFQEGLGSLADRFVGPSQWEQEARCEPDFGPTADQVVASLRGDGHRHVDYPMAQAYAAGVVMQRCLEEAGSSDSQALREAAARLRFSTFYGEFEIDGQTGRQTGRETLLVQWQGGRKVVVWPAQLAQGTLVYPWR